MEKKLIKEILLMGGRFDHRSLQSHEMCQKLGIWPLVLKDLLTTVAAHDLIHCNSMRYWEVSLKGLVFFAPTLTKDEHTQEETKCLSTMPI